jgi:hypothetical protein
MSADWSFTNAAGVELRVMALPDRKSLYLVLVDDDGLHCVAKSMGDREAAALVAWLDAALGAR